MANKLEGVEAITRKLKLLPDRIGYRALGRSLRKGARVVANAARANAQAFDDPETASRVAKNVSVQAGSKRRALAEGGPVMRIGVLGGAQGGGRDGSRDALPGGDTRHWRHIEFGTSDTRARPFLRAAGVSAGAAAFEAVLTSAPAEIDKELAKLK